MPTPNTIEFNASMNQLLVSFWCYLDDFGIESFDDLDERHRAKVVNYFHKHFVTYP